MHKQRRAGTARDSRNNTSQALASSPAESSNHVHDRHRFVSFVPRQLAACSVYFSEFDSRTGKLQQMLVDVLSQLEQLRSEIQQNSCSATSHSGGTMSTPHSPLADHEAHQHHQHHHHHHLSAYSIPIFHVVVDLLNIIGVAIMVFSTVGVIIPVILNILPSFFLHTLSPTAQESILTCRMQLSRGIMLGMDFMVGADVIETVFGEVDMVKLILVVAIRSWLGWERGKEMEHMTHELQHWKKAQGALLEKLGDDINVKNFA
eukprot:765837-Hanusia_phi.AAC.2